MNKNNYYLAIMAGGVGSRFWPASREGRPKQFLDMLGTGSSLLQMTNSRFTSILPQERIYCVTNSFYTDLVHGQLPDMPESNIIGEPSRNNTAPSVLYTALLIARENPDAVIGFVPSDHLILKEAAYLEKVSAAFKFASENDAIVTLGIEPTRPDTGYGYIKYSGTASDNQVFKVIKFTEKPDLEKAVQMLEEGNYLWNAGMFFMKVNTLIMAYKNLSPDIYELFEPVLSIHSQVEQNEFLVSNYPKSRNVSIDYAIIEKSDNVYTIPADIGWSDLGTWTSLYHEIEKDQEGNALQCPQVILDNVRNTLVRNNTGKLIILRDVQDLIVVDEEDVLMIYPMNKEQEIKLLGNKIKEKYASYL